MLINTLEFTYAEEKPDMKRINQGILLKNGD
ncbi:hypothetical protein X792_07575 [Dehalococcoides mccartyi CG1]|nr:hypothetical protein X792_07575 [Dehalococcoides mccartyi CG1]